MNNLKDSPLNTRKGKGKGNKLKHLNEIQSKKPQRKS